MLRRGGMSPARCGTARRIWRGKSGWMSLSGWGALATPTAPGQGDLEKAIDGLARSADVMAAATVCSGELIAGVRMLVRDAIATLASRLAVYAARDRGNPRRRDSRWWRGRPSP